MLTYSAKRAFEILREEGSVRLAKAIRAHFSRRWKYFSRGIKARRTELEMNRLFDAVADPYKIINVNSEDITRYLENLPGESYSALWGRVEGGEWDRKNTIPIEEYPHYQAFTNRFIHGHSWEESGIIEHKMLLKRKRITLPHKGCDTWDEVRQNLIEYYQKYDRLYQDIQQNGFQLSRQKIPYHRDYDAPCMAIGRHGEFIFRGDGHHRIAIAKLLELDKIPVYIYLRHEQWQEFRDEIHNSGLTEGREELRDHPDLQDILD